MMNERVLSLALQTSLALDSEVQRISAFDRKHYSYPDLPAGYQITQKYRKFSFFLDAWKNPPFMRLGEQDE